MGVGVLSRANQKFPGGEQGQRGNQKWGRGRRVRERSSAPFGTYQQLMKVLIELRKRKGEKLLDVPEGTRKFIGSTVVRHFNNYNYPLTLGGHQALKRMWQKVEEEITATCAGNHMSGEKEEWFFFLFYFILFFRRQHPGDSGIF